MKSKNFLSNLWSLLVGSRKDDGSTRLRVDYDSITCRLRVWPLKLVSVLVIVLTIGSGNVWGAETDTLSCSKGTISNNTMTFSTTNFTFTHEKGTGQNFAAYTPWRVYQNNTVTITAGSNVTSIDKIEIVHNSTYYGTITSSSGIVTMANTSGGTTTINSTSGKTITLTNTGQQSRWNSIMITYTIESSCDKKVTLTKGLETNGTFTLDKANGSYDNCDDNFVVTVSNIIPTSNAKYCNGINVTGGNTNVTGPVDGVWTVTYTKGYNITSTITPTYADKTPATISFENMGNPTPTTIGYYVGDIYTLPVTNDYTCGDKTFVGWSTVEVAETDTKPTSNFYEKGASVTLEASQTFYAVFATESGGGSSVMRIDFEGESSTYSDWTFTNLNSQQTGTITAKGGTYYGTTGGNATASVTTKNKIASPTSLTAYVSKETKNTTSSTWYIRVSSDLSTWTNVKSQSATSMTKGTWVEMTADLTAYSDVYVQVYYEGSTAVRNIDDLTLTIGGGPTYSAYSTSCAECANNVTVNYTAAPAGGTVAVTNGGAAVAAGSTVKTCTGGASLVVTVTPSTHYSVSSVTFTPSAGLVAGDLSGTSTPASTTAGVWTYNVTIAEDAAGTLTIAPTFTEDAHVAINWNVNGSNLDLSGSAAQGLTWVYSGGDITALPSEPSVPAGCSGTKVFAGWSTKHSDATEQEASWYDDLFTAVGDAPTGITSAQTYYAVFATSSSNPLAGEVMWAEDFGGFSEGEVPNTSYGSAHTGTTVYNSGNVTYACTNGGTTTKIYAANLAGGTSPEILVSKSNGQFDVTGIPTSGQTELTLTYKCNKGTTAFEVSSATGTVTVGDASVEGSTYTRTITISQPPSATNSFALTFKQTTSDNARLDDIHLVVPGSGTMTDYVTLCAPSWTITYDKNTSDPVTNLPSPTSVLQSTGTGTLSATKPTRATYTFGGWATTAGGAKVYDAGDAITGVTADKTLYAVWTKTPVEEINLNHHILEKYVGDDAVTLAVTSVVPDGADMSVTWSSSNSSVAPVVAATGVVTFGTVGKATITATSTVTGTITAECDVTVRNKPTATFYDLIHGTDLSTYNLQNVAGTSIVFPTLSNTEPGAETCEDQHYIFVGWTTSDNNDDPQDHLVTSGVLENDQDKVFYAVWADGVEGVSYTKLSTNSFKAAPTKYVIAAEYNSNTYYFYSCASTDANNGNGGCTTTPATNAPIQFTLSGTADALVATSTETTTRYLKPLTANNFQMSASSQTLALNTDGTIGKPDTDPQWRLRFNTSNKYLRWYNNSTGSAAYFYEVTAGAAVSYRTSCCTNNVAAPSVTATNTAYTVTLKWDAVAGATGYEVSWNGGAFEAATSPCVKSGLTASTTYTYKVRATYNEAVHCGARVASGNVTTDDVYSVTYSGGTGTGSCSPTGSVATVTYEAGKTVTLAATNSYGLTSNNFAAWVVKDAENNDVAVSNNQFRMPASNVTVTATWTAVQDKYYDRMHQSTDASHGGIADGNGKYYIVREGCNYTVPAPADDKTGDTDCHTTHYKLLGWIAQSHLKSDGSIKDGEESFIFQGGTIKSAIGATYYAIYAIMTE